MLDIVTEELKSVSETAWGVILCDRKSEQAEDIFVFWPKYVTSVGPVL